MYITVLNIQHQQVDNQFEVIMNIGNKQESYCVQIDEINGITCINFETKFKKYLMKNADKNKLMTTIVMNFYKSNQVDFPVELGEFKI
ncbi:MAG: hypothetical protein SAL07_25790 [Oscillatoria sp. PMC 1051.18]|nr:hypothetical protein [Oscillatoria sp. PMC 1050.18]MEC5033321.1 hypothetical protein [Oscillatoria sp. PMC 1051.18]